MRSRRSIRRTCLSLLASACVLSGCAGPDERSETSATPSPPVVSSEELPEVQADAVIPEFDEPAADLYGEVALEDLDGYSYAYEVFAALDHAYDDITNAPPGQTDVFWGFDGSFDQAHLTNVTDGRDAPAGPDGAGPPVLLVAYPMSSAICMDLSPPEDSGNQGALGAEIVLDGTSSGYCGIRANELTRIGVATSELMGAGETIDYVTSPMVSGPRAYRVEDTDAPALVAAFEEEPAGSLLAYPYGLGGGLGLGRSDNPTTAGCDLYVGPTGYGLVWQSSSLIDCPSLAQD